MTDASQGVIVGANHKQEWILPWWWFHYHQSNDYPVLFLNFGDLSKEALRWCAARGEVKLLNQEMAFLAQKESVAPELAQKWEQRHPNVWQARAIWFKKPFALQHAPFTQNVWIDIDMQIRGSIRHLFECCDNAGGLAIAKESERSQQFNRVSGLVSEGEVVYNAGLIAFQKESPLIQEWLKQVELLNNRFCSDQQLLGHILSTTTLPFHTLPHSYNWTPDLGAPQHQIILHWWGDLGKSIIRNQINFLTKQIFINLSFQDVG